MRVVPSQVRASQPAGDGWASIFVVRDPAATLDVVDGTRDPSGDGSGAQFSQRGPVLFHVRRLQMSGECGG